MGDGAAAIDAKPAAAEPLGRQALVRGRAWLSWADTAERLNAPLKRWVRGEQPAEPSGQAGLGVVDLDCPGLVQPAAFRVLSNADERRTNTVRLRVN